MPVLGSTDDRSMAMSVWATVLVAELGGLFHGVLQHRIGTLATNERAGQPLDARASCVAMSSRKPLIALSSSELISAMVRYISA